jgi:CDP-2,3-bis-(O-geranylgeranyl)-sn-glycerol synthase
MPVDIFNIYILVEALWLVLPIYAANGLVPLFKGKVPLDLGRSMPDGKRILGPGKTIEGFLAGCFFGMLIAIVEQLAFPYLPWGLSEVPLTVIAMSPALGLLLGFGAMIGDAAGSFIKRRIGLGRGRPAPLLDQLDFLVGSLLISSLVITVKFEWFVILIIMTPIIHWTASAIGYMLKVKKEPW